MFQFIVLLNLFLVQGHVRMFYDSGVAGAVARRIRNANGEGNGGFSVAGPCGGQANWGGADGLQYDDAAPGDKVTLKINYNGGHRSAANRFAVRALCGPQGSGPTQDQMKAATDLDAGVCNVISCPNANEYPCKAPNGNAFTEGYIFECTIPNSFLGTGNQAQDCTYSVLDQRDWGGCVDVRVSGTPAATGVPEATDAPQSTVEVTTAAVPYDKGSHTLFFSMQKVDVASPKYQDCCCTMTGPNQSAFLVSDTGMLTATIDLVCPSVVTRFKDVESGQTVINEQLTYKSANNWESVIMVSGQQMTFSLIGNTIYYVNTDMNEPMICDGELVVGDDPSTVTVPGTDGCTDMQRTEEIAMFNSASAFSIFILCVLAIANL